MNASAVVVTAILSGIATAAEAGLTFYSGQSVHTTDPGMLPSTDTHSDVNDQGHVITADIDPSDTGTGGDAGCIVAFDENGQFETIKSVKVDSKVDKAYCI